MAGCWSAPRSRSNGKARVLGRSQYSPNCDHVSKPPGKRPRPARSTTSFAVEADNSNLRTQLERTTYNAGLSPWPKLFQNLRASRVTELANVHPAHVATVWLGLSTVLANKHCWQVAEDDFNKAIQGGAQTPQNPAQQAHANGRTESHDESAAHKKAPVLQGFAADCDTMQTGEVGGTGLERPPESSGNSGVPLQRGTESGTVGAPDDLIDADLRAIIAAWPDLSDSTKAAIVAQVRADP